MELLELYVICSESQYLKKERQIGYRNYHLFNNKYNITFHHSIKKTPIEASKKSNEMENFKSQGKQRSSKTKT